MKKDNSSSYLNKPLFSQDDRENKQASDYSTLSAPQIMLPKSGGSILSIDDKFSVNAASGTSGFSIGFSFSVFRNDFLPSMAPSYSSGGGSGAFGPGWSGKRAFKTRKSDKKLPEYNDE